jgi:SpoVK/Ycf46/Vps4 family AAA+-type ATPase
MLAKAVATESGASFINVSMASIGSKWFGEAEKYARAVFTLATKVAPCIIFIDEVDAMLGRRDKHGEHEGMRKVKNELMSMWDGLKSSESERVIVLAATNRPFDLDEAVLRRMPRRILIDLPDVANRKKILTLQLAKEELGSDVSIDALAADTDGFTGSDLKQLCIAAAYEPIREFLLNEKAAAAKTLTLADATAATLAAPSDDQPLQQVEQLQQPVFAVSDAMDVDAEGASKKTDEVALRPLRMDDFRKALKQISPSVSEDAFSIAELRKWNQLYGEGGNRTKESLTYFM